MTTLHPRLPRSIPVNRPSATLAVIIWGLLACGVGSCSKPTGAPTGGRAGETSADTKAGTVSEGAAATVDAGTPTTDATPTEPAPAATAPSDGAAAALAAIRAEEGEESGDARAELERGESLRKTGHYDQAIEVLSAARKISAPDDVRAGLLEALAEAHFRFGQEADWERLDHGLSADPDEQFHAARRRFEQLCLRFPEDVERASNARYMVGSCYLVLGDQKNALAHYQRAYEDYPEPLSRRARALLRVGVCQAGIGRPEEAQATWMRYLRETQGAADLESARRKVYAYLNQLQLVGKPAPELLANEWLQGVASGLAALRGDVVVLVFFSTGCPHCKKEMPRVRRDIQRWTPKGVVYLGVSDPTDPQAESPVDSYVATNRLDFFDVAIDRGGRNQRPYRVTGFPAAVVIDRKGVIRWRGHYAFLSYTLLEDLLATGS